MFADETSQNIVLFSFIRNANIENKKMGSTTATILPISKKSTIYITQFVFA